VKKQFKKNRYIIIEGAIGVGKTTLASYLSNALHAHRLLEAVEENPFLVNGFYQNIEAHAFNTEMFFLLARFRQQRQISKILTNPRSVIVSDYLFQKNKLFASMTLSDEDYETFCAVFEPIAQLSPEPDLVVYLKSDVTTLLNRIRLRDRHFERDIQKEYLEKLVQKYEIFFESYTNKPLLTINASEIDFVQEEQDLETVLQTITEHPINTQIVQEGTLL
jgi:deoxyguanosine kinase